MCGIAGFTHSARIVEESVIHKMTSTLVHRGPDQQGTYFGPSAALGAVRLQVIDLDGGDQPIRDNERQTAVVYNGEIFNFREIREELLTRGHRFRTNCDTEVAMRAFLEWDTDCFQRFRGMFAIAIWCDRTRRLVLARDRMGIKPLYIHRHGRDVIFGSELKALFAHPWVTRDLDLAGLQDFLSFNYVPGKRTLVKGIEKLPGGHYLEWRDGETRIVPYWRLRFDPNPTLRIEDATEELDRLLRDAVREQLVSDVPLGLWASGGLDSSTLLHHAAEQSPTPVKTFSIAFQERSCDEREYFREIARIYGTDHHEFELRAETEVCSAIEDFSYFSDEPGADSGALPVWFLSKMSRKHVTVALSGEGGDELFGGYMTYQADKLARPLRKLPELFRKTALATAHKFLPVSDAKISFEYKLKRWLEGSLLHPDEAHLYWNGTFSEEQKRHLLNGRQNGHRPRDLYRTLPDESELGFVNRYLMLDQQYFLPDNLLYKVDRMSMAHSLEVRPPLLDHRIVEFAANLPEKFKINGSEQKVLLKRAMRGKLPSFILDRKKSGLDIPAHDWFRGPLFPMLRDTLNADAVRKTHLFNPDATDRLIRDHKEKRINAGYHLWGLLTLFLWLKRWNIQTAPLEEVEALPARELLATAS